MSSPKRNLVPAKPELCPHKDIPFCRGGVSCCGRLASVESRGPWPLCPSAFTWNVFKVHPFQSIYQSFISLRVWVRSRCLYSLWFVYPLINWWTIGPFCMGPFSFLLRKYWGVELVVTFLGKCQAAFCRGCSITHSREQCIVPTRPC